MLDPSISAFDRGLVVGLLISEGSFGGDGKQPQITLRLHVRREAVVRHLMELFPRTKLYGPYNHGERSYYQWMARGAALVEDLLPLLEDAVTEDLDGHACDRLRQMCERYATYIARVRTRGERTRRATDPAGQPDASGASGQCDEADPR